MADDEWGDFGGFDDEAPAAAVDTYEPELDTVLTSAIHMANTPMIPVKHVLPGGDTVEQHAPDASTAVSTALLVPPALPVAAATTVSNAASGGSAQVDAEWDAFESAAMPDEPAASAAVSDQHTSPAAANSPRTPRVATSNIQPEPISVPHVDTSSLALTPRTPKVTVDLQSDTMATAAMSEVDTGHPSLGPSLDGTPVHSPSMQAQQAELDSMIAFDHITPAASPRAPVTSVASIAQSPLAVEERISTEDSPDILGDKAVSISPLSPAVAAASAAVPVSASPQVAAQQSLEADEELDLDFESSEPVPAPAAAAMTAALDAAAANLSSTEPASSGVVDAAVIGDSPAMQGGNVEVPAQDMPVADSEPLTAALSGLEASSALPPVQTDSSSSSVAAVSAPANDSLELVADHALSGDQSVTAAGSAIVASSESVVESSIPLTSTATPVDDEFDAFTRADAEPAPAASAPARGSMSPAAAGTLPVDTTPDSHAALAAAEDEFTNGVDDGFDEWSSAPPPALGSQADAASGAAVSTSTAAV